MARTSSEDYWRQREEEQRRHNISDEREIQKQLQQIYQSMIDEISKEINGFYGKYARQEGITMTEAMKRAEKLDIEAYARKAKRYVQQAKEERQSPGSTDKGFFSKQANDEMRLYNMTMKVNRLELLKSSIGLEMVRGFDEITEVMDGALYDRATAELARQAGILGKTVQDNAKWARNIVNASFHHARFSDRIWAAQDVLKAELAKELSTGIIQGRHPRVLAANIRKRMGVSQHDAERLMRTELARVQTEAQKVSFQENGYDEYEFIALGATACPICAGLNGKHFKVRDMQIGRNAPPMHPNCRCSVAAWMDRSRMDYENTFNEAMAEAIGVDGSHTIDYLEAVRFAGNDAKLINKLRSGSAQLVAEAVQAILESELDLPKTAWNGKIVTVRDGGLGKNTLGIAGWDRRIYVCESNRSDIQTHVHENIHMRSIIKYGEAIGRPLLIKHRAVEDGPVELLTQEILKKKGLEYRDRYSEYVDPLRRIRKIVLPKVNDCDFALKLIDLPITERYNYLKEIVEDYKVSNPKIRDKVLEELTNALKELKGGTS